MIKYHGTIDELKTLVMSKGIQGEWQSDGSKQTFRSYDGGVMNYWPNGTIQFQGKGEAKEQLKQLVMDALSAQEQNPVPETVNQGEAVPCVPPEPISTISGENCCKSAAMLRRVKKALSRYGISILLVNGKVTILTPDFGFDIRSSLAKYGSEIYIREL